MDALRSGHVDIADLLIQRHRVFICRVVSTCIMMVSHYKHPVSWDWWVFFTRRNIADDDQGLLSPRIVWVDVFITRPSQIKLLNSVFYNLTKIQYFSDTPSCDGEYWKFDSFRNYENQICWDNIQVSHLWILNFSKFVEICKCRGYFLLAEPFDRVMQLNWLYFCGICQLIPLKLCKNHIHLTDAVCTLWQIQSRNVGHRCMQYYELHIESKVLRPAAMHHTVVQLLVINIGICLASSYNVLEQTISSYCTVISKAELENKQ